MSARVETRTRFASGPVSTEPCAGEVVLSSGEIRDLLCMYRDGGVFLEKAALRGDRLVAEFRTFEHPFLRSQPKHLTREHVLLFVTQAAYVLAGSLRHLTEAWPVDPMEFARLAAVEQAVFTRVNLEFWRFIANQHGVAMEMLCERFRVRDGKVFARFTFTFPEGCQGYCEGLIALDNSLKPGRDI